MFGDCDTCSAKFSVPTAAAMRNRIAGFVCLWVGLSLWAIYVFKNGLIGLCCGSDEEMPYPVFLRHPRGLKQHLNPNTFIYREAMRMKKNGFDANGLPTDNCPAPEPEINVMVSTHLDVESPGLTAGEDSKL